LCLKLYRQNWVSNKRIEFGKPAFIAKISFQLTSKKLMLKRLTIQTSVKN
jgi:hypothetical protein